MSCDSCGNELGNRFYQGVPGQGDLCIPCWTEWFTAQSEVLQEQEQKEPDGEGELIDYVVVREEVHLTDFYVKACSASEARRIVSSGGGEMGDSELSHDINTDEWKVYEDGVGSPVEVEGDKAEEEDDAG